MFRSKPQRTFENSATDKQKALRSYLYATAELAVEKIHVAIRNGDADAALKWIKIAEQCRSLGFSLPLDLR